MKKDKDYNVLGNFLRGNYSLVVSYWVFGLGLGILSLVLAILLEALFQIKLINSLSILALVTAGYWLIGVWASCKFYKGKKIWIILAKIATAVYLLQSLFGLKDIVI